MENSISYVWSISKEAFTNQEVSPTETDPIKRLRKF